MVDLSERERSIQRILFWVLFLNLAVAAAKLLVGWLSASISMVADGFHSVTDSAANVVGLVGVSVARKPPDEDHPYGHRKFETLAALLIGGLLALTAAEILRSCIQRVMEGGAPRVTTLAFTVMIATMAVNVAVSTYERRRATALKSELLRADAAHTRSDIGTSLAVLLSLFAAKLGHPELDVVAAVLITGAIAWAAFTILRDSGLLLTDTAFVPSERIREIAVAVPGVESAHKIRTRGRPELGHADLHVQVRPDLRLDEAHVIGHMVAERIKSELGLRDVLVHVEPPVGHQTSWRPKSDT